ncbi:hypothetical protein MSG28_002030 [Choristoneura fumiferana]|uniref:Uncharacterized protein n=2 Tax=Choristoneura fumiferana TaxID=7141 RepID=A0ACC0JTR2_CHOFU|nr:hypothetical protein MSG28_002030 [Choristoneura fumiferana]
MAGGTPTDPRVPYVTLAMDPVYAELRPPLKGRGDKRNKEGGTNPTSEDSDTNMPHNDANMIVVPAHYKGYLCKLHSKSSSKVPVSSSGSSLSDALNQNVPFQLKKCLFCFRKQVNANASTTPKNQAKPQQIQVSIVQKSDDIDDEFNTIPLSVNGNIHSAGNAV